MPGTRDRNLAVDRGTVVLKWLLCIAAWALDTNHTMGLRFRRVPALCCAKYVVWPHRVQTRVFATPTMHYLLPHTTTATDARDARSQLRPTPRGSAGRPAIYRGEGSRWNRYGVNREA